MSFGPLAGLFLLSDFKVATLSSVDDIFLCLIFFDTTFVFLDFDLHIVQHDKYGVHGLRLSLHFPPRLITTTLLPPVSAIPPYINITLPVILLSGEWRLRFVLISSLA